MMTKKRKGKKKKQAKRKQKSKGKQKRYSPTPPGMIENMYDQVERIN